jgi:hypothetical protein
MLARGKQAQRIEEAEVRALVRGPTETAWLRVVDAKAPRNRMVASFSLDG